MKKKASQRPTLAQLQARIEELERLVTQRSSPCCHHIVTQPCALPHYPCTLPHQPTITWGTQMMWDANGAYVPVTSQPSLGATTFTPFTYTTNTQH